MKVLGYFMKAFLIIFLWGVVGVFCENVSEKENIIKHIPIGEEVRAGNLKIKIGKVEIEGNQMKVDVELEVLGQYSMNIYEEYTPFDFLPITNTEEYYRKPLEVVLDEEFRDPYNILSEENKNIWIPAGRTKTLTFLVTIPEDIKGVEMEYSNYRGRTFSLVSFDIPIK